MKKLHIIGFVVLLTACGGQIEKSDTPTVKEGATRVVLTKAQAKNAAIVTGQIEKRELTHKLTVSGKIDVPPQNMVSVSVPLGGYLKATRMLPGMHIRKGEVIAVMEDQQYIQLQQDYLVAKAKLIYAEREFERQTALNSTKASSDKVLQQAESEFVTQKIMVRAFAEKLRLVSINPEKLTEDNITKSINIYSPIDGYVTHVNVNIGKFIQPSDVLFELVNPADIHLALTLFEKDLGNIFIGQKVIAYNNRNPEIKHLCEVILIGKNLSADRNAEVHCHFDKYDEQLIPGMFMNAEIQLHAGISDAVPEESVVNFEGSNFVFVEAGDGAFDMVKVETGNTDNGYTQLKGNIAGISSKRIVVKGAYTLLMQLKNTPEEE